MRRTPYVVRRNNTLYFRVAVPPELRRLVGGREVVRSLKTADAAVAAPRALRLAANAKLLFMSLRARQGRTPRRARFDASSGIAVACGASGLPEVKRRKITDEVFEVDYSIKFDLGDDGAARSVEITAEPHESDAVAQVVRELRGARSTTPKQAKEAVSLLTLFDGWVRERKPRGKTQASFRSRVGAFVQVVGFDDATRVTAEDAVRWKDELVASGKTDRTINDG